MHLKMSSAKMAAILSRGRWVKVVTYRTTLGTGSSLSVGKIVLKSVARELGYVWHLQKLVENVAKWAIFRDVAIHSPRIISMKSIDGGCLFTRWTGHLTGWHQKNLWVKMVVKSSQKTILWKSNQSKIKIKRTSKISPVNQMKNQLFCNTRLMSRHCQILMLKFCIMRPHLIIQNRHLIIWLMRNLVYCKPNVCLILEQLSPVFQPIFLIKFPGNLSRHCHIVASSFRVLVVFRNEWKNEWN